MRVRVTQDDIDNGERHDGSSCAAALAFQRALKDAYQLDEEPPVMVNTEDMTCKCMGKSMAWPTPKKAQQFIFQFDECTHRRPDPIEFDLELDPFTRTTKGEICEFTLPKTTSTEVAEGAIITAPSPVPFAENCMSSLT